MKYIKLFKPGKDNEYCATRGRTIYTDYMYKYDTFEGTDQYFKIPNMLVGYGKSNKIWTSTLTENRAVMNSLVHVRIDEINHPLGSIETLEVRFGTGFDVGSGVNLLIFAVDPTKLSSNTDNIAHYAPLTREHIKRFEGTGLAPVRVNAQAGLTEDKYIVFQIGDIIANASSSTELYIAFELPYTFHAYKSIFGTTNGPEPVSIRFAPHATVSCVFGNVTNLLYFDPEKVTDDAFRVFENLPKYGIKTKQDLATFEYRTPKNQVFGSITENKYLTDYKYYDEHRNYVAFKNVGDTSGEIFMSDYANGVVEWCKSKFSSITPQLLNTPDLDNDKWKTFETKPTLAPGEAIVIRSCRSCGTTFNPKFNIILEASGDIRTVLNYISLPTTMFGDTMDFNRCSNFTTPPDFSKIEEIGYYGCHGYFRGCGFSNPPDFSNVKKVGEGGFDRCFEECYELKSSPDFSNVKKVGAGGFEYCFGGCYQLNKVTAPNVSTWDRAVFYCWLGVDPYSSGVVRKPAKLEIPTDSDSGVPKGWTTENY